MKQIENGLTAYFFDNLQTSVATCIMHKKYDSHRNGDTILPNNFLTKTQIPTPIQEYVRSLAFLGATPLTAEYWVHIHMSCDYAAAV